MSTAAAVGFRASVTRGALLEGLRFVQGAAKKGDALPVLECVLIRAEEGALVLSCTDLDSFTEMRVAADVEGEGTLAAPVREFSQLVASLSEGAAELRVESQTLHVLSRAGKYRISGLAGEEFPQVPEVDFSGGWDVSRALVARVAKEIGGFASDEPSRPMMQNVHWDRQGDVVRFTATTGTRLGRITVPAHDGFPKYGAFCANPAAFALAAALPGDGETVRAAGSDRLIGFRAGPATVCTRLVDGLFPNVDQVIPKNNDKTLIVERAALMAVVKRALVVADETTQSVWFGFSRDNVVRLDASSRDRGAGSDEFQAVSYEGGEIRIGFNGNFLMAALACVPGDQVRITMSEPLRAVTVQADEPAPDHMYLVMPVSDLSLNPPKSPGRKK